MVSSFLRITSKKYFPKTPRNVKKSEQAKNDQNMTGDISAPEKLPYTRFLPLILVDILVDAKKISAAPVELLCSF